MEKREFLKLSAAAIAAGFAYPFFGCAGKEKKLLNWAGNYTYGTGNLLKPSTTPEVRNMVLGQDKVKALGTRHCFNGIADSKDCLLSTEGLVDLVNLDRAANTVTVGAGIRYGQLADYLQQEGFALHNLASLPHISIAGACATATHGSGTGNLASAVVAFEIVTADGEVKTVSRATNPEEFAGMVVSLGAFGIITNITLRVEPTFDVRQDVYLDLSFDQLEDHFDAIMSSGYSVSLFTDWQNGNVSEVWVKSRMDAADPFEAAAEFYGARAATEHVHPIIGVSPENCTEQLGVPGPWHERLPHFKMGFTPSKGEELQSEYFVPRQQAYRAMQAIRELSAAIEPHLFISEIRSIAADDLWMSTAYGRESVALHFTWKPHTSAVMALLPKIEAQLAPFDPRPHWGKLFTMPAADLQQRYPKYGDFKRLVQQYDPNGKFSNAFLEKHLL